jgi:hypothetical protein
VLLQFETIPKGPASVLFPILEAQFADFPFLVTDATLYAAMDSLTCGNA